MTGDPRLPDYVPEPEGDPRMPRAAVGPSASLIPGTYGRGGGSSSSPPDPATGAAWGDSNGNSGWATSDGRSGGSSGVSAIPSLPLVRIYGDGMASDAPRPVVKVPDAILDRMANAMVDPELTKPEYCERITPGTAIRRKVLARALAYAEAAGWVLQPK
jgi:hypothetical protein